MATKVQIKRVYEEPDADDGYRVLVDRLWPRGVRKDALQLDEWAKQVAPSTEARKQFAHQADRFDDFKGRYLQELDTNPAADEFVEEVRSLAGQHAGDLTVTLLYAARDPEVNHAVVLRDWLERRLAQPAGDSGRR